MKLIYQSPKKEKRQSQPSDQLDRIQNTHRFGVALDDPPTYGLIGLPQRGPSGLVLNLILVTDGSDA